MKGKLIAILISIFTVSAVGVTVPIVLSNKHEHSYEIVKYDENQHWKECSCGEKSDITAHSYDNACDSTCNGCDYTRTVTHNYATKSNGTNHWQECTVCGDKKDTTAHTYSTQKYDNSQHWKECSCGEKSDIANHSYDNACDTTCNDCDYTRTVTHNYVTKSDATNHWQECAVCGDKKDTTAHTYAEGLCSCGDIQNAGYTYNASTQSYSLTNGKNIVATSISIPNIYDDGVNGSHPVTSIGSFAFDGCSALTSITIPNSITSIGAYAFNCSGMTSVNILSIESWCNINFETSGANPLWNGLNLYLNNELVTSLVIPEGVTSIGSFAFYGCSSLTSITIPAGVVSIGEMAFYSCRKLVEVYNLSSLDIKAGDSSYGYVAEKAKDVYTSLDCQSKLTTDENGYVIYTNNDDKILIAYIGSGTDLELSAGITEINRYAFYKNSKITSVTISNGVTGIGENAFNGCKTLSTVQFEEECKLSTIDKSAFNACTLLASITIPNSVTSIGENAFDSCKTLSTVQFEEGCKLSTIGKSAFNACTLLASITIPNSVISIGESAFWGCSALASITIPNSVISIGESAFWGCSALASITIPKSVTNIDSDAFACCFNLKDVYISDLKSWCNISFENEYANPLCYAAKLYLNDVLVTNLVIPSDVTSIGDYAFDKCSSITSVTISDGVTSIGKMAFYQCFALTSLIISNSVTSIGDYAVEGCSKLTKVYYKGNKTNWENITSKLGALDGLRYVTTCYYIENETDVPTDGGNYWHYDSEGNVVEWQKTTEE